MSVFKITPTTQKYDWGKIGRSSKVAVFAEASGIPGFAIDDASPYAELWMGTHPSSPSVVSSTGQLLSDHLKAQPDLVREKVRARFEGGDEGNLPFLFKVLSIAKALSIQVHPDKQTAEILHAQQPKVYKDPNHKPEMALAITPFRALCGFRLLPEIAASLESTAELRALIPSSILDGFFASMSSTDSSTPEFKSALRDLFASVMSASTADVKKNLEELVARYQALPSGQEGKGTGKGVVDLVLTLNEQFPDDIGIFCAFLLNEVHLQPGEAIFLGAGEPHAYLSGECMECMANSDNVIRAGLTPKLRDVPNLITNLTYNPAPPVKHFVQPSAFTSTYTKLYNPPIPEFSILQTSLPPGGKEFHPALGGPSIAILTSGRKVNVSWIDERGEEKSVNSTLTVGLGDVFFIGASVALTFENLDEEVQEGDAVVYRAFVEV